MEVFAKFGPFTVGLSDLRGTLAFVRSSREAGWDMRFRTEPRWHLPPLVGRLVRGSLRHPFAGEGAHFRLTVQQLGNGQSVLHRRSSVTVHESTIMRWLGNLGFTALSEFAGAVEQQEARYYETAMRGMRRTSERSARECSADEHSRIRLRRSLLAAAGAVDPVGSHLAVPSSRAAEDYLTHRHWNSTSYRTMAGCLHVF